MKVRNIKKIAPKEVYAVQTNTGTFIADGLAHHNCYHCNINLSGNWVEYRERMVTLYGEPYVKHLEQRRHEITKDFDYEAKIEEYKRKCEELGAEVR